MIKINISKTIPIGTILKNFALIVCDFSLYPIMSIIRENTIKIVVQTKLTIKK